MSSVRVERTSMRPTFSVRVSGPGDINTWLEKANRDVSTFYATEAGNPKVVPNIDSRTLLGWVADQITQRGWENDFFGMAPVASVRRQPIRTGQHELADPRCDHRRQPGAE